MRQVVWKVFPEVTGRALVLFANAAVEIEQSVGRLCRGGSRWDFAVNGSRMHSADRHEQPQS